MRRGSNVVGRARPRPLALALALTAFLAGCAPSADRPPNVLVILVDTLRADHLGFYGYERETAPEIARRLARRGVVVEEAYAQSNWTVPSVASLLTGERPDAMLDERGEPVGIPAEMTTLGERLGALGWQTAAFIGNPTVYSGDGFAQGFGAFFAPPRGASMRIHAGKVNEPALAWLEAWRDGPRTSPFFVYLHYLDPHDPYGSPDVGDRAPAYPDYAGPIRGSHVHGLFLGAVELADPEDDLAHLAALYDSEIRWVDRHVGQILDALPEEELANTLVVFTADHGEELLDHGGWKHGPTLYEEAIHVPLVVRWDARIPAGRRLDGTVRLLDVVPTVMSAVGAPLPPGEGAGVDLLPSLVDGEPVPRRPAFSQKLGGSRPLRIAMVDGPRKLVLFNRHVPFEPSGPRDAALWRDEVARLERVELYDLEADPTERHNLADQGELAAALDPLLRRLDERLRGLRVVASGLEPGSTLRGELRFGSEPARVTPLFLAPEDELVRDGAAISFRLHADPVAKGLLVEGDLGSITSWRLELDGREIAPTLPSADTSAPPVRLAALTAAEYPPPPAGPALRLWTRPSARTHAPVGDETVERLRELGYVD